MKMIWRACGLLGGLILFGSAATAIETKPTITLDLAKKMAAGCEAKATQEKWKMNIAVVNDGTHLVYFEHMDGAFLGSIYISQQKAITAANFPFPPGASAKWPSVLTANPVRRPASRMFPALLHSPAACRS